MYWFTYTYWKYLFKGCTGWTNFWCRVRGHPGVFWNNAGGLKPDMRCTRCFEDLG